MGRKVAVDYRDPNPRHIVDPAGGRRVRRCRTCGMPGGVAEIVGYWQGAPVRYPVCAHCVDPYIVRDTLTA